MQESYSERIAIYTGPESCGVPHGTPSLSGLPSNTQGGSRMRESRTYRLCAGAHSNMRPYRDPYQPQSFHLSDN
jgi:hypothetical protein